MTVFLPKVCGIYLITNSANGKRYVGSANNVEKRHKRHIYQLSNGSHGNQHLQRAWNEYGSDAFSFRLLEECPLEALEGREQYYMDLWSVYNPELGYNIRSTAFNGPLTQETKDKISAANRGRRWSVEAKARMADRCRGNQYRLGKPHTGEACRQMSLTRKGRKMPPHVGPAVRIRCSKRVVQYTLDMQQIAVHASTRSAASTLGLRDTNIAQTARGESVTCGGFLWIYENDLLEAEKVGIKPAVLHAALREVGICRRRQGDRNRSEARKRKRRAERAIG